MATIVVLKKIQVDNATGILIVPNWKSQAWFPMFKELTTSKIITLKPNKYSLICPFTRVKHPLQDKLMLIIAVVSGSRCLYRKPAKQFYKPRVQNQLGINIKE